MIISIIETDFHPEVLRDFCNLLENSNYHIQIFTTEKIWKKVDLYKNGLPSCFALYLKPVNKSTRTFIKEHLTPINQSDIIFLNTVASNFRFFSKLTLIPPVILRVHNINTWLNPSRNILFPTCNLFDLWKTLSHLFRRELLNQDWFFRKKLLRKVDYLMFPNQPITDYVINNKLIHPDKVINPPIPFSYYYRNIKEEAQKEGNKTITVSVIGSVDQRRRDYDFLLKAIHKAIPELREKLNLILLGRLKGKYGKRIQKELQKIRSSNFKVTVFNQFIEQNQFESYLKQTDFLLLPINLKTKFTIYTEYYGKTKISGNVNDAIKNGIPFLIPKDYPLSDAEKEISEQYRDINDLSEKLIKWIHQKPFERFNIEKALQPYKIQSGLKILDNLINNIKQ